MDRHKPKLGNMFKLTRLFAMSFVVLAFAVSAVIVLPTPLSERLLRDDMIRRGTQWNNRMINLLSSRDRVFEKGMVSDADAIRLGLFIASSDVYRFKMFNRNGIVFHSSLKSEIGSSAGNPYFRDIVARGNIYYKQTTKPASAIDGFHTENTTRIYNPDEPRIVSEIYVPVILKGEFVGATEFYRDITDIHATFVKRMRTTLAIFSAFGVLIAYGAIGAIAMSGQNQLKSVRQRAESERQMMQDQIRLSREVRLLSELNEWLQSSRSLEELFDMVSAFMSRLLANCAGSIYVYSNSRDVLDGACSWNGGELHAHIKPESCWGLRRGRSYAYGTSEIDFACEHVEGHSGRPYICFPILAHGETVGLMTLMSREGVTAEKFQDSRKLARMCAEHISLAIANVRMRDQLHHQSIRDPLTGLYNRRHFTENLRKYIESSNRKGGALSLISIDVDHFKKFNDNHGHDAGDMVLRAVGATLEHLCDGDELPCRLGGEEFMALLPETDGDAALIRAEEIRSAVEEILVRYGEKTLPRITISLGISTYPKHGSMPQDLIKAADNALYDAKAKGRNQTCVAGVARSGRPANKGKTSPGKPVTGPQREQTKPAAPKPLTNVQAITSKGNT